MADNLLQPRIGGLYHGVSRQAPLLRSPNQMEELDNFLPSVDLGAIVDRDGTRHIAGLSKSSYASSGHYFFRTTDGERWVLLRRVEAGELEVRNLTTGVAATLTYGPYVRGYIAAQQNLRYLTLSDTTFILNPDVVVTASSAAKPALTECYVHIKRLSSAAQSFTVSSNLGSAAYTLALNAGTGVTRSFAALQLAASIQATQPGLTAWTVAPGVIKVSGAPEHIASVVASNDWDESAILLIKGRVSAASDLPSLFEANVPIKVVPGMGNEDSGYYVCYDRQVNAWRECSYLPNLQATGDLQDGTMPIRLRQTAAYGFELVQTDWVSRKTGDDDSNPAPQFVGKRITAMCQWKGRLWFAADDTLTGSQPDDLYNFYRESAREVRPADPVSLSVDSPDLGVVRHLVAFRNKLMVMSDTSQLELDPGTAPVTPDTASLGVATRYSLDKDCEPTVVGDVMFYTGTSENRAVLWEYAYQQESANNSATDLSKHVPGYCPGAVKRIRGSSTAGRSYCWSSNDPGRLYVNTGYWKEQQRAQNAWSRLSFPGVAVIRNHWVSDGKLYILGAGSDAHNTLWLLSADVDGNLGDQTPDHLRLDYRQQAQITWNAPRNRSEVMLPPGYESLDNLRIAVQVTGAWRSYPLTKVWDGAQWLAHFSTNTGLTFGQLGCLVTRTAVFSPFYPSLGETVTPVGRLQVAKVVLDALVSGDFTATVTRSDRVPTVTQRSPRMVGEALVPDTGYNLQHRIPFNSKGDEATLTVTTDSLGATALSGFTLLGRYTNPTAP